MKLGGELISFFSSELLLLLLLLLLRTSFLLALVSLLFVLNKIFIYFANGVES